MRKLTLTAMLLASTAAPALAQEDFARFVDPAEHAYSIDVPAGWHVNGGTTRRSAMQAHFITKLSSPNGRTVFVLGNLDGWQYSAPNAMDAKLGYGEGKIVSPGADNEMKRHYRTGEQWAVEYGQAYLAGGCQNLRLVRHQPNTRGSMAPTRSPATGLVTTSSAGEAFFTCVRDGQPYDGYVYAQTHAMGIPGSYVNTLWDADCTFMFLTPHGHGIEAGILLARMLKTVQINPQWLTTQMRLSGDLANHVISVANAALAANESGMLSSFASDAQAAQDANQEDMRRLISGFDEYKSNSTGYTYTVPYASGNDYWSNGRQVVPTLPGYSPGAGFEKLQQVPLNQ